MPQRKSKPVTVLVVSRDPELADVRRVTLEKAGFAVVPATDAHSVTAACQEHSIEVALIGYSLAPADKRVIANSIRESCKVPVLELHQQGGPELMPPTYFHHSHTPEDFVDAVRAVLRTIA